MPHEGHQDRSVTLRRLVPRPLRPAASRAYRAARRAAKSGAEAREIWRKKRAILGSYGVGLLSVPGWRYLLFGRECDNFTYDIRNLDELADFLGASLECERGLALKYIFELEHDSAFRRRLTSRLRGRKRNRRARYGRRLGWYAAARIRKPQLVVETGVHDGLGSAVLLQALDLNRAEGHPGRLISFDIRPEAGWLVDQSPETDFDLRIGDTLTLLSSALAGEALELFVHDSDHSHDHEMFELETALASALPGAVLISDNARFGTAFTEFCDRYGLTPFIFIEQPRRHFYPGAAIGLTRVPRKGPAR